MAWIEAISSVLGIGMGAGLAVSIYKGAVAIEKELRAEAKENLANFIKHTNFQSNSQVITDLIVHMFEVIFGKNHLSVKCIWAINRCIVRILDGIHNGILP